MCRSVLAMLPWLALLDGEPVSDTEKFDASAAHDAALRSAASFLQHSPAPPTAFDGGSLTFTATRTDGSQASVTLITEAAPSRDSAVDPPAHPRPRAHNENDENAFVSPRKPSSPARAEHRGALLPSARHLPSAVQADAKRLLRLSSARAEEGGGGGAGDGGDNTPHSGSPPPQHAGSTVARHPPGGAGVAASPLHAFDSSGLSSRVQGGPPSMCAFEPNVLVQMSAARARVAALEMENALLRRATGQGLRGVGKSGSGDAGAESGWATRDEGEAEAGSHERQQHRRGAGVFSPDSLHGSPRTESAALLRDAVGGVRRLQDEEEEGAPLALILGAAGAVDAPTTDAATSPLHPSAPPCTDVHAFVPGGEPPRAAGECGVDVRHEPSPLARKSRLPAAATKGSVPLAQRVALAMQLQEREAVLVAERTPAAAVHVAVMTAPPPPPRPSPAGGVAHGVAQRRALSASAAALHLPQWKEEVTGVKCTAQQLAHPARGEGAGGAPASSPIKTSHKPDAAPLPQPLRAKVSPTLLQVQAAVDKAAEKRQGPHKQLMPPLPEQRSHGTLPLDVAASPPSAGTLEEGVGTQHSTSSPSSSSSALVTSPSKAKSGGQFGGGGARQDARPVAGRFALGVGSPSSPRKVRSRVEPIQGAHDAHARAAHASAALVSATYRGADGHGRARVCSGGGTLCTAVSGGQGLQPHEQHSTSLASTEAEDKNRWTLFAQAQLETLLLLRQAHARLLAEYDSAKEETRELRCKLEGAQAEAVVGGLALRSLQACGRGGAAAAVESLNTSLMTLGGGEENVSTHRQRRQGGVKELADAGTQAGSGTLAHTQERDCEVSALRRELATAQASAASATDETARVTAELRQAVDIARGWKTAFSALQGRHEELMERVEALQEAAQGEGAAVAAHAVWTASLRRE